MIYINEFKRESEVDAYYQGAQKILFQHAWWKDSVQYVGSGHYTYHEMRERLKVEREKALTRVRKFGRVRVSV